MLVRPFLRRSLLVPRILVSEGFPSRDRLSDRGRQTMAVDRQNSSLTAAGQSAEPVLSRRHVACDIGRRRCGYEAIACGCVTGHQQTCCLSIPERSERGVGPRAQIRRAHRRADQGLDLSVERFPRGFDQLLGFWVSRARLERAVETATLDRVLDTTSCGTNVRAAATEVAAPVENQTAVRSPYDPEQISGVGLLAASDTGTDRTVSRSLVAATGFRPR